MSITATIIVSIVCSFIGAIIHAKYESVLSSLIHKKGEYAGRWEAHSLGDKGDPRTDILIIKQRPNGAELKGDIVRRSPTSQRDRRWRFSGRITGRQFYAIFWSIGNNTNSYGCWYVRQTGPDKFEGFYYGLQHAASVSYCSRLSALMSIRG